VNFDSPFNPLIFRRSRNLLADNEV